jgi:hypothetical protein
VVFKVDPSGKESVLYAFTGGADGYAPYGDLLRDEAGSLYGAASNGGDVSGFCGDVVLNTTGFLGCGTVFKLDQTGKFTVLHTLADGGPFPDGWLVRDNEGNLYGMSGNGGDLSGCSGLGCGVVFKLDTRGKERPSSTPLLGVRKERIRTQICSRTRRATSTADSGRRRLVMQPYVRLRGGVQDRP